MITPISGISPTQRLYRYSFQMLQASLKSPVSPVITYPLQSLYNKQQAWANDTAKTLSALYVTSRAVMKAAKPFDRLDLGSVFNTDKSQIVQQTKKLVSDYNRLNEFLRQHVDELGIDLHNSIQRLLRNSRNQLELIGLEASSDGSLTLNENRLELMMEQDFTAVERGLASSSGLATRLYSKTEELQEIPVVSYSAYSGDVGTGNPYQNSFLSSLFFSQAAHTGLFFNQVF